VLDPDAMKKYCEENGKTFDAELCKDKALIQTVYDGMMELATGAKLNSLEKPK